MFIVTITRHFSAAHALSIGGKCENLHGHNFRVDVSVKGNILGEDGILIDFRDLKRWTEDVLEELDHKYLNEIENFAGQCASSENVARYVYEQVAKRMRGLSVRISEVTVWESDQTRVTYTGEGR